ncbi:MAG: hypothetical protein KZQ63_11070, partial [Candidatus Thiodiazotropha sp. (ex Lucinoma aequizonata)]|nr:hypothetical protein [Candidatus Thiodiazotropha sp. (ex Lucinoma aequizonata)]MCU7907615.1 hypothetical protein [Candidatus Thiodiazotropha sp. (ex Lucinoma aequizonata)]MCU7912526.1 hypothetical protein [Candidatus Thiodiazotropha sp. (ex Lucinoma aequizonata)]
INRSAPVLSNSVNGSLIVSLPVSLTTLFFLYRGVSPMNDCFDASQQQINQIRRFYSISQTPDSVITRISLGEDLWGLSYLSLSSITL